MNWQLTLHHIFTIALCIVAVQGYEERRKGRRREEKKERRQGEKRRRRGRRKRRRMREDRWGKQKEKLIQ